jgi:hypothetical protein
MMPQGSLVKLLSEILVQRIQGSKDSRGQGTTKENRRTRQRYRRVNIEQGIMNIEGFENI